MNKKKKVLVVDDDLDILEIIEIVVSQPDIESVSASSVDEAIRKLEEHGDFNLILTDYSMPSKNADELIGYVRNSERLKDLPIYIVTGGRVGRENIGDYVTDNSNGIVLKPFGSDELLKLIRED